MESVMMRIYSTSILLLISLTSVSAQIAPPQGGGFTRAKAVEAQIDIKFLVVALPQKTAAHWGLDGGAPVAAQDTPLGREIPSVMSKQDADKLTKGLRSVEGAKILGAGSMMTLNGNTCVMKKVEEMFFPEQWTENEKGEPKPEIGGAREVGVVLEMTAMAKGDIVDVEMNPEITRFVGWTELDAAGKRRMPIIAKTTFATRFTSRSGSTHLFTAASAHETNKAENTVIVMLLSLAVH
jgi:hypothetical protein